MNVIHFFSHTTSLEVMKAQAEKSPVCVIWTMLCYYTLTTCNQYVRECIYVFVCFSCLLCANHSEGAGQSEINEIQLLPHRHAAWGDLERERTD